MITEAIRIARRYRWPILRIPPTGCVDEVITVDLRGNLPVVTREPSSNYAPGAPLTAKDRAEKAAKR